MNNAKRSCRGLMTFLLAAFFSASANAHLMPAQQGTLNFTDEYAFLVVSLPATAFANLDRDGDGAVTMLEFNRHRAEIAGAVTSGIALVGGARRFRLEGVMLSPVIHESGPSATLDQLTVMGRFTLPEGVDGFEFSLGFAPDTDRDVEFSLELFGSARNERAVKMTASYRSAGLSHSFVLTPDNNTGRVRVDVGRSLGELRPASTVVVL